MILIGLGSNLQFCGAAPPQIVEKAIAALGSIVAISRVSSLYASPAWPDPSHPPFANAVVCGGCGLSPEGLLMALHAIEAGFGRRRTRPNAPRTLDLDLIAYGDRLLDGPNDGALVVPHPRLAERDFVLAPICEIAPNWRDPRSGRTARDLLDRLRVDRPGERGGARPVAPQEADRLFSR